MVAGAAGCGLRTDRQILMARSAAGGLTAATVPPRPHLTLSRALLLTMLLALQVSAVAGWCPLGFIPSWSFPSTPKVHSFFQN